MAFEFRLRESRRRFAAPWLAALTVALWAAVVSAQSENRSERGEPTSTERPANAAEEQTADSHGREPPPATMGSTPTIAVVRTRGDEAIALRLVAELEALGYVVVEVRGSEAQKPLMFIAQRRSVHALVRATPSRTGIELLVLEGAEPGGEPIEDVVSVGRRPSYDLLALRAVEALRARFLEAGFGATAEEVDEDTMDPSVDSIVEPEPEAPSRPRGWFEVAAALGGDFEAGYSPRVQLGFRLQMSETSAFSVLASGALTPFEVARESGTAAVWTHWAGVAWDQRLVRFGAWSWEAGMGVAVAHFRVRGHAMEPYEGRRGAMTTGMPFARTSFGMELSSALELRFETLIGWTVPRPVILIVDEEVGWGRPYLQGSFVLAWSWFG